MVINQSGGALSSAVFLYYSKLDQRVRDITLIIKFWAKRRQVNNSKNSTLSSYGWMIMTIHFLQNVSPPVVPIVALPLEENVEDLNWKSENSETIPQLLVKFFLFYSIIIKSTEDIESTSLLSKIISIERLNCDCQMKIVDEQTIDVDDNRIGQLISPRWRLCIQDPIDHSFDLGRVIYHIEGQIFIFSEIRRALIILTQSQFYSFEDGLCQINENPLVFPMICSLCHEEGHVKDNCFQYHCASCGGRGHSSGNCPSMICFHCKGPHFSKNCDKNTKLLISKSLLTEQEINYDQSSSGSHFGAKFLDTVLTWTAHEMNNELLLFNSMNHLPQIYDDASHWYTSFFPFILDETRAQLNAIFEKKFADINHYKCSIELPPKSEFDEYELGAATATIYVVFPSDINIAVLSAMEPFSLGLLVHQCPDVLTKIDDLRHQLINMEYPLDLSSNKLNKQEIAIVDKHPHCFIVRATIATTHHFMDINEGNWSVVILGIGSLASVRIWDSLVRQEASDLLMNDVLTGFSEYGVEKSEPLIKLKPKWEVYCKDLNESQRNAVQSVLQVGYEDIPRIQLIKGPPGII